MKRTTEFSEWLAYFDRGKENIKEIYQMYMAVKDNRSYEPFYLDTQNNGIILSCPSMGVQLYIASENARLCLLHTMKDWYGEDIELAYEMSHGRNDD